MYTLVDRLRDMISNQPDKLVFEYLENDLGDLSVLSYQRLHEKALSVAGLLLECQVNPGDRVLLLYAPGLEFISSFLGCLYAGVIAVPAYPPRKSRLKNNLDRLEKITIDCAPKMLLCDSVVSDVMSFAGELGTELQKQKQKQYQLLTLPFHVTSSLDKIIQPVLPTVDPACVAFIQYTSGSTGDPKGVIVSHENLMDNSKHISQLFNTCEYNRGVSWLPQYHDMGLIGVILQTMYCGGTTTLFSPGLFVQSPLLWLQTISKRKAFGSGAPNFAFDYCCDRFSLEKMQGVDLSCWKMAFSGAEPVSAKTLERFSDTFAPYGFNKEAFCPVYGMAEHTLICTGGDSAKLFKVTSVDAEKLALSGVVAVTEGGEKVTRDYVACGKIIDGHELLIVDPETRMALDNGCVGEVWSKGKSVTQGYWGKVELSKYAFQAMTATGEGPFLRTGDLGFVLNERLHITSRMKDLIIIRGRNYAPQDIENAVEGSHSAIRKSAVCAFSYKDGMQTKLAVVAELNRTSLKLDHNQTISALIKAVNKENELTVSAVWLLKPGRVYKTTSGKIQRRRMKKAFLKRELDPFFSWGSVLELTEADKVRGEELELDEDLLRGQLMTWLSSKLGLNRDTISGESAFIDLGLDSMLMVEASDYIMSLTGKSVTAMDLVEHPTIDSLLRFLINEAEAQEVNTTDQSSVINSGSNSQFAQNYMRQLLTNSRDIVEADQQFAQYTQLKQKDLWPYSTYRQGAQRSEVKIQSHGGKVYDVINMSSYNYLGYSCHPDVIEAAKAALDQYGLGANSSPVIGGQLSVHQRLEEALVRFFGLESHSVSLFSSGYAVNVGTISAIMKPSTNIVMDELSHMSIVEGAKASGAKLHFFKHNDLSSLEEKLVSLSDSDKRVMVCVESIYSADGDFCPLAGVIDLAKKYHAYTLLDEAHSMLLSGQDGRGFAAEQGLLDQVDFNVLTFSKSFGGVGGCVFAKKELVHYIDYFAKARVFSCAMDPAVAGGLVKVIELVSGDDGCERRERLYRNCQYLVRLLSEFLNIETDLQWIIPVVFGDENNALAVYSYLQQHGVDAGVMVYPSVPVGKGRIRLFITSEHTAKQLDRVAEVMRSAAIQFNFDSFKEGIVSTKEEDYV